MVRSILLLLAFPALQDDSPSFAKDQRLAATYYYSGPETRHAAEFLEMGKAGVEIALVSFQGGAEGLDPLVAALDGLERDAKARPRLAVFFQPGPTLDFTPADQFYARVPKRHWAMIDGRPLVWLAPAPAGPVPDRAAFAGKIGRLARAPYLVAEISWTEAPADRTYAWGGTRGFAVDLPVVSVGPGTRNRGDGTFYERSWYKAIRLEPRLVAIESWNGAADGVSETPERKRKYLDATRRYVRDFKVNEKIVLPKGKWTPATQVAYSAVYTPHDQGLRPVAVEDGIFDEVRLRGFDGLTTKENKKGSVRRLCFDVDDSFCYYEKRAFEVAVEFLDLGEGSFSLEYDSGDRTLPAEQRVVKSAGVARFTGSGEWRTESFQLPDAVFGNGQPGGSDFRISVDQRGITVRSVIVLHR
jgi:hypothetical protein